MRICIKGIFQTDWLSRCAANALIGDVAFETRDELEKCKKSAGDEWDNDEIYFVAEELRKYFPEISFMPVSYCAGILTLQR